MAAQYAVNQCLFFRKIGLYDSCLCFSHYGCQLLGRCFADTLHAFELLEQRTFCLFSDAFYLVQCRGYLPFAAFVAVEGDGKAVYFILNLRQQPEEGGVLFQSDGLGREAVQQLGSAVFAILGKSGDGDVQTKFVHHLFYGAHLPFPAVGDKKVGQGSFFFYGALIAPFYDFFHGSIVVRPLYGLDIVLAVIFLGRFPLDEDHAPGHGVGTLDIGVVEAFYLHGQAVQVQLLLYLFQQTYGPLFRIQFFGLFQTVGFVLLHVEDGEFQQFLFVSPLRKPG